MNLPDPCNSHLGVRCPACGLVHERVRDFPDQPATDQFVNQLRTAHEYHFVDAVTTIPIKDALGYTHLAEQGAAWITDELVVTTDGRSRTLAYTGDEWVVTGDVPHEPTDDAESIHECVLALAEVAAPGDTIDDLPFDLDR